MNKISKLLTAGLLTATCLTGLTSCGEPSKYDATTEFFYSSDAGATYGNRTKEFSVGEDVYMLLRILIQTDSSQEKKVKVELTIPYITSVYSKYFDGQPINPDVDEVNHVTYYNFYVLASDHAKVNEFTFKFIPNAPTDITMSAVYDDNVDPLFDRQNTITFKATESNESNTEETTQGE